MNVFIKIEDKFMTATDVPHTVISVGNKEFEIYVALKIPYEIKDLTAALRLLADKVDRKINNLEVSKYLDKHNQK